jgi:flagellar assembly protein FliH
MRPLLRQKIMGPILRSPAISEQKRKLGSKFGVVAPAPARPPTSPPVAPVPALARHDEQVVQLTAKIRAELRAEFQGEADALRDQARQQGMAEGRAAGEEDGRRSLDAAVAELQAVTAKIPQALAAGIRGVEDIAVAIAYEASCKMMGDMAHLREGILALVQQAAAYAHNVESAVVRLGTRDFITLREAGALTDTLPSGLAVRWLADDGISVGGCVIETDGGDIDARLDMQFDRLRQTLLRVRGDK